MERRAVWVPDGAPPGRLAGGEALVLRALGDAYADHAGPTDPGGAAWPELSELAARATVAPEALRRVLHDRERRGLLRVHPSPPRSPPQPALGGPAVPAPTESPEPYSAGGSTPSALASLRTVDGWAERCPSSNRLIVAWATPDAAARSR
jgi:hypothetical protein